jgi:RimJ/RimL family protein N-acetyltransferase
MLEHGVINGKAALFEGLHCTFQIDRIQLTVVSSNDAARRLYERKGFVTYGIEPNALCVEGLRYDELLMVKRFEQQVPPSPEEPQ